MEITTNSIEYKKSIFRQRYVEAKEFKTYINANLTHPYVDNYGRIITTHQVPKKSYEITNILKEQNLIIIDISMPTLSAGERFYIVDLDKVVKIQEPIRCSDDTILYIVEDIIINDTNRHLVEDMDLSIELTLIKEELHRLKIKYTEEIKELKNEINEANSDRDNFKDKYYKNSETLSKYRNYKILKHIIEGKE